MVGSRRKGRTENRGDIMPRVLLGQIKHETNTFSRLATTLDDYRARYLVYGDDLTSFTNTETEVGGYREAAKRYGWTLVNTLAANATPSGPVTADAWNHLRDTLLAGLDRGP